MYELTVCNTSLNDGRTEEMGERITRAITFTSVAMARPSIVILFDLSSLANAPLETHSGATAITGMVAAAH